MKVGDIVKGSDVGMPARWYIKVSCPYCPEGQDTRLAEYKRYNPAYCTSIRRCKEHKMRQNNFNARRSA